MKLKIPVIPFSILLLILGIAGMLGTIPEDFKFFYMAIVGFLLGILAVHYKLISLKD